ncbi:hypothetical protein BV898_12367 [Hypsibius exemplaris]|uniref:Uncharacterized protein n=1 Tax=Hypsibius exemplaris TaxID=2072580 RepID=A0A1W0WDX4_HYPEX|nr:hypothetical protein BV898_12367 [Hypsibius exemplaris]
MRDGWEGKTFNWDPEGRTMSGSPDLSAEEVSIYIQEAGYKMIEFETYNPDTDTFRYDPAKWELWKTHLQAFVDKGVVQKRRPEAITAANVALDMMTKLEKKRAADLSAFQSA